MKRKNSLKRDLKRHITAIALFSVIFSTLVITIFYGQHLWRQLRSEQVYYTNYTASKIDNWFQEHLVKLLFVSQFSDLVNETGGYRQKALNSTVESYTAFSNIFITDAAGNVVAGQNRLFDPQYQYQLSRINLGVVTKNGEEFIGTPEWIRQIDEFQMPVAYPLRDGSGRINGALCAHLDLNYLDYIINSIDYGRTGFGFIISPQNLVIMHNAPIETESIQPERNLFLELVDSPSQFHYTSGLTGQKVMATYQNLETVNWFLVINHPLKDLLRDLYQVIVLIIGSGIIALLLGMELAIRYIKKIDEPLQKLTQAASSIASGDLTTSIVVEQENELQDLARAFNYTTSQMRLLFDGLDKRCSFESMLGKITRRIISTRLDMSAELTNELLGDVGQYLAASRSSIHLYNNTQKTFHCHCIWHQDDKRTPKSHAPQNIDTKIYPNVMPLLKSNQVLVFDLDDSNKTLGDTFPKAALTSEASATVLKETPFYRDMQAQGLRHLVIMPIRDEDELIGLISFCFDKYAGELSLPDTDSLDTIHNILVSAFIYIRKRMHFREDHERLKATLYGIGDAVIATDAIGIISLINPVACRMTGWNEKDAIGMPFDHVFKIADIDSRQPKQADFITNLQYDITYCREEMTILHSKNGFEYYISYSAARINNIYGKMAGAVIVFRDETQNYLRDKEQVKLQRLEAVSLLAAGIAHDFNNLLTTILGNISLALQLLPAQSEVVDILRSAEISTEKGRDITKQLLVYAKGGSPERKISSIVNLTDDTLGFLLQGSRIKVTKDIPSSTWKVNMAPGVYNQIISNVIINARQAMSTNGHLQVTAENISLDFGSPLPLSPGSYVLLSITDDGEGIDPAILPKIFDPYVTTKNTGTGLGLTSAFALLQKHGGYITITSEPGVGTTAKIYFQAADEIAYSQDDETGLAENRSKRILVFESEPSLQNLFKKVLSVKDTSVDVSASLVETLEWFKTALEENRPYDCFILDIDILNREYLQTVVNEIKVLCRRVILILACEFVAPSIETDLKNVGFDEVIVKPFHVSDLRKLIRRRTSG